MPTIDLSMIHSGTSGFRGQTNVEISVTHALLVGDCFAAFLRQTLCRAPKLAVGHDQRNGAEALAAAAMAGALAAGADVEWLGQVSTGVFSAVSFLGDEPMDGGILITGSHMGPERIGIILMNRDGTYCDVEVTDVVERWLETGRLHSARPLFLGKSHRVDTETSESIYLRALVERLDVEGIRSLRFGEKNPKILIDPGNGTTGAVARALLVGLGCEVAQIFAEPKEVPDRESECRASSCGEAMSRVVSEACHLGVCFDGDGDRVLLIDERGKAVGEDLMGALFAKHCVKRGEVVVTPVNSSRLIEVVCEKVGATVRYCKIGQPDTGTAIKRERAVFAYESSAKYAFPKDGFIWYDGVFAVAKLLEIMGRTDKPLSELIADLPAFYHEEHGLEVPDSGKAQVIARAVEVVRASLRGDLIDVNTLDGTRINLTGHTYVMLRASGTEPKVRLYVDGPSRERVSTLSSIALGILQAAIMELKGE